METVVCNLCGHNSSHLVYQVKDTNYGQAGTFSLVTCERCGLVYLNPRPTTQEIGNYYPADQYHPFRALQKTQAIKPSDMQQKRADKISQLVNNHEKRPILDVGCGSGLFLLAMEQRGWQVFGVEPSDHASNFARTTLNLPVLTGDIFAAQPGTTFDVITFWDVLEHTHSPRAVLQEAHRLLNPNGLLAINVPNWASWERKIFRDKWIAIDAPRHLYHFSPSTLSQLLQSCGFSVMEMRSQTPVMNPASNLLRALGALARSAKHTKNKGQSTSQRATPTISPSPIKRWFIRATDIILSIPNLIANAVGQGGSITVYARKSDK